MTITASRQGRRRCNPPAADVVANVGRSFGDNVQSAMPFPPGDRLGTDVIVGPLGAGGMGQVYKALGGAVAARLGNREAALRHAATLEQAPSEPGGATELRRAQLAALLGRREQAVSLLRDAFARGLSMSTGLHRHMDLESLRGFAPFDELMKPKG